jgi:hypothetical protein
MYSSIRRLLFLALLALAPSVLYADGTVDRSFVCSEKLRTIRQRSFKPGLCNLAGVMSAMLDSLDGEPIKTKVASCEKAKTECLDSVNSAKFKKRIKKAQQKCIESESLPDYSCPVSTDIISDCFDQLAIAMKKVSRYSCETILKDAKKSSGTTKGVPSCELIKASCPEVVEAMSFSNL